jgi:hypothetical protein
MRIVWARAASLSYPRVRLPAIPLAVSHCPRHHGCEVETKDQETNIKKLTWAQTSINDVWACL